MQALESGHAAGGKHGQAAAASGSVRALPAAQQAPVGSSAGGLHAASALCTSQGAKTIAGMLHVLVLQHQARMCRKGSLLQPVVPSPFLALLGQYLLQLPSDKPVQLATGLLSQAGFYLQVLHRPSGLWREWQSSVARSRRLIPGTLGFMYQ